MPSLFSGQAPFRFVHRSDLRNLPGEAAAHEVNLHGGFAVDRRPGQGQIYYGMPGCGIMRVEADLSHQEIIALPDVLRPLNFHSTKIGEFDGTLRLFLPANSDEKVAVLNLDGSVEFVLSRPELEEYAAAETPYRPTDTALVGDQLYVADGYGANYISINDLPTRAWTGVFGGKTEDAHAHGKFATAHGLNLHPTHHHLTIADRPSSRIQAHDLDGRFVESYGVPAGAWPCGIDYVEYKGRLLAVIGCLRDPVADRPAPIYILDGENFELLSTIRPKEELGVDLAQHLHNVVFHVHKEQLYLICQAWNPGCYFVLELI